MVLVVSLLLPLVPALAALTLRRSVAMARLGAGVLALGCITALSSAGDDVSWRRSWIGPLGLDIHLVADPFAVLMLALICGLGALVLWYSAGYFPEHRAYGRFVGLFLIFAAAMNGLVLSADLFTMFLFWEVTSVVSFLLIGMNDESASARAAALRALLVTGTGGLCLLVGVALFQVAVGTTTFTELVAAEGSGTMFAVAAMFALMGALTKSAQFPFHFWLPGAMSAPTPVSAYLHSATMVKAGIVLLARLSPAVDHVAAWRWTVVLLGGTTMIVGGVRALRQTDAKLLLAHSTVSQLGLLTMLAGMGSPLALYAAVAHLAAHAVFKAGLFLAVGAVDHATGTREITELSGLRRSMPVVALLATVSAASMAGVPPLLGFVTKEKALAVLLDGQGLPAETLVALGAIVAGSVLSVAYSVRLVRGLFGTAPGRAPTVVHHPAESVLVVPVAVTVVVTVGAALVAGWWGSLMRFAAMSLDVMAAGKLVLWPGFGEPLFVSAMVLGVGAWIGWHVPDRPRWPSLQPSGEVVFERAYDGLLRISVAITRVSQSGSLVVYNLVVFSALALAVGVPALGMLGDIEGDVVLADSAVQVVLVVLGIAFALAAVRAEGRLSAALLAGGLGFASAALFALFGAPDLALTQLLVEGLVIVVLLLVLRRLPRRFENDRAWLPRWSRLLVSGAVGAAMAVFALAASLSRTAPSVGGEYLARSAPEGAGNNVVNVILVDFRGTDTLGEVTVLVVAGLGVANLLRHARRRSSASRARVDA